MKTFKTHSILLAVLVSAFSYSPQTSASVLASIVCDQIGTGFICSASPTEFQGDTYTYFWRSTGPQFSPNASCFAGPTDNPFCHESCLQGTFTGIVEVSVTVVENATGDSDSASKTLNCATGGGGGF